MVKKYYRKRFIEENSSDNPEGTKKINFEKSNRQEGKKEIASQAEETSSKEDLSELIWEVEMKLASKCYSDNIKRKEQGLPEKCDCPLPELLTLEELLDIMSKHE
jgi:hypothetical protein